MSENIINDIVAYTLDEALVSNYYLFRVPPLTIVGDGATAKLGEHMKKLKVKHSFIVTDKVIVKLGLLEQTLRSLKKMNIAYTIYDEVEPDPTDLMVYNGVNFYKQSQADCIIGFGGGSPIDAAKAIAVLVNNNLQLNSANIEENINDRPPLVAVPTTAGTGTEVTDVTVITNTTTNVKMVIKHPLMVPDIALIDPNLTLNISPYITAATGIDVLTHAIEAYVARSSCTLARALSHRAIRLVMKYLPTAVGYGANIIARHKMAVACYMAGMAFSNAGLGLCHSMAHQLGATYKIPHGVANALLLPHIMRFNLLVRLDRFVEIAHIIDERFEQLTKKEAALKGIDAIAQMISEIGLPTQLREIGAICEDFNMMAENALKDITIKTNPRSANIDDIIKIFESAY